MPAIAASTSANSDAVTAARAARRPWASIAIETDIAALADIWRAFEASALVTPYQSYDWVRHFAETIGAAHDMTFRYALVHDATGTLCALLPLVVTGRSGFRFAEFIGGKHANYHMGLYAPGFAARLDAALTAQMLTEIGSAIGGLDALAFVNQPVNWQGVTNPAAQLAAGPSPSRAYKLALIAGDGDATLRRSMSSHARKKLKNKHSRFKDFGPSTLVRAATPEEITRIIDAFLSQKAERFRSMGVPDPFAEPAMRAFLERAAIACGSARPAIELYSLDLAGRSVATYVGTIQGERFSGMATSFDMASETVKTSPGELLLAELIRLKAREGVAVFDLGVGEARYKTTFCDDHDDLVDSFLPLTFKGRVFARIARTKRDLKRRIKRSPMALKLAQRASGWLRSRRSEEE
ncbi:GNAT family N-acetyltransferase [Bosea robiniae]|uniref:Acetyltransferase involved in cellulose biosynthesis, CelD/BcsL family n=1 Tax=Bosea robiniae TaxID=1036780 RepID=A0ABY0ND33_9HYPH|nr:GNAT family N-acetyltransferase [Bosea robiniae]SDF30097.1 Acetyltransferase involved in cellulose biosynthesis, CelD/BcsL family [Bosea robiniae]